MVGSQISFMSLWSPSLPVYSYLTACPLPGPCVLHLWALSTWGLATCPIPRVLFSAGEGKRCWTLPRCAYVLEKGRGLSSRETPGLSSNSCILRRGDRTGQQRGTTWSQGMDPWRLPSSLPPHQVPWRPLAQTSPRPCPVAGERGTTLHLKVI